MFQFPRCPPHILCIQIWVTWHDPRRVSPFGHRRIIAWLAATRRLSQPPTSFIGTIRQGIPHVLFVTFFFSWRMIDTLFTSLSFIPRKKAIFVTLFSRKYEVVNVRTKKRDYLSRQPRVKIQQSRLNGGFSLGLLSVHVWLPSL